MHKKAEESSIQYSCSVDASVCVHALQMCVRARASDVCVENFSHVRLNKNARIGGNA